MTIYEDLEPVKARVVAHIASMGKRATSDEHARLKALCKPLNVDQGKLNSLLRSCILAGNKTSAAKVIMGCPDRKFNGWGYLLISPVTVPLAIIIWVLSAPMAILNWMAKHS